ncbi:hypothetical protein [Paenibacillus sp. FSL R10-2778]|uniref:hypothetical protein n=1 Tax=Paenibacillus sp. FSL R10-2778 TaxID=2954659 RepID=UPI00315866F1
MSEAGKVFLPSMTPEQLALLKSDIKAEILRDLTKQDLRVSHSAAKSPLADLYAKYKGPLYEKFGVGVWAQVWEAIRKLATFRAGHRYIRELLPSEEVEAAEFAEGLLIQLLGEGESQCRHQNR